MTTKIPVELSSTPGIVDGSNATAITIDSSENVMIGNTDSTPYDRTSGNAIALGDGLISSAQEGGNAAIFNRMTSDGSIVDFRKAGSSIGSIGTQGGDLNIGTAACGIAFVDGVPAVYPWTTSGNATRDAAIDLGDSGGRFKDLYLSGGAYIGGTATANQLDDYEEGTWTPTTTNGSATFGNSSYTKIGRLVNCFTQVGSFTDVSSGNAVTIASLPFTAIASDKAVTIGSLAQHIDTGFGTIAGGYLESTSGIRLYNTSSSSFRFLKHSDLNSSTSVYVAFTYMTA